MRTGDEDTVAEIVRARRQRMALSQADLAERARLATKTVQRLETGQPVAAHSRRAILEVLGIDPMEIGDAAEAQPWSELADAAALLKGIAEASSVDIDLDREGWLQARAERPWYRQEVVIRVGDPLKLILQIIDETVAEEAGSLAPGLAAQRCDTLAAALSAASATAWAFATRVADDGRLDLYAGSPAGVAERVGGAC